jgi:hypothetical protein
VVLLDGEAVLRVSIVKYHQEQADVPIHARVIAHATALILESAFRSNGFDILPDSKTSDIQGIP